MSSARPSSRSRSRWRWTAGIIKSVRARCTIARDESCSVYGHVIHDTASVRPRLLRRRDHEGKLEHRHGADRRSGRRDAAEGVPQQDGLPRQGRDRAAGNVAATLTPGSRWGPFETMTIGFGHGIAVTPLHLATRLCDPVQRRHLSPADPAQGRPRPSGRAGPPGVLRRDQLSHALAAAAGRHEGHRARRPTRPAIGSAARPAPPRSCSTATIRRRRWSRASRVCSRWTSRAM